MTGRGLKQTLTYVGRTTLGTHRAGFALLRLSPRLRPHLVAAATDVCIEGFPRSANSLAVHGFRLDNPTARIAHHVHVPMQVVRAAELGVPCAVLIRRPLDAIASLLIMSEEALPRRLAISTYESFYERVADRRDSLVLVEFEDVVSDPFVVARRVNDRFDVEFGVPEDPIDGRDRALESIHTANREPGRRGTALTVPSQEKESIKPRVLEELTREPRIDRLAELYESLLAAR